jgi:hypothetical protein
MKKRQAKQVSQSKKKKKAFREITADASTFTEVESRKNAR